MKYFLPACSLLLLAIAGLARAQDQDNQMAAPPDEVVTDFGIEEYLNVPKYTFTMGLRTMSGAKSSFTGRGFISSFQPGSDSTTPNITRIYHDGNVLADTEPYTFTITHDDGTTTTYTSPQTPPGLTNTWSFLDPTQIRDDGNIDFHSYTADVVDSGFHQKNPGAGSGIDLAIDRDIGKIGKRIEVKLHFGASLTDIKSHTSDTLAASITTITDTYAPNLNGQTALPTPPYTAPSWPGVPQVDADGNPIYDSTGAQVVDYVETTVLLGNTPLNRTTTVNSGTVLTQWDLKGAYFTFRLGPSVDFHITDHLRATLSAGAAFVYAGTTYTVEQDYQPETYQPVTATVTNDEGKFLLGYYVDANLQYDFTDSAGFYAGMGYEGAGSYTETVAYTDPNTGSYGNFKALVNLSSLQGFRMGMSFRY